MVRATIQEIEYYLPEQIETNVDLQAEFPNWPMERIEEKTGILQRHIAAEGECASDLAVKAALKLFAKGVCRAADIDFILLCTQSADYFLLQHRLGIPATAGALDFNLGCSGYIYGLGLAKGLIETGQAANVLLLTADTFSKFISPEDRSVRAIFGDAASATWVRGCEAADGDSDWIGPCVWGTDGCGAPNLMVPAGGMRDREGRGEVAQDDLGNARSDRHLFMNGGEIFRFTVRRVPETVERLLSRAQLTAGDIDLFVFHQATQQLLEHLRRKLGIPAEKFPICLKNCGNTISCSIPIALNESASSGLLRSGARVMIVGFGVGYSWGAAILTWR
jgi:3-oxoacyl-[acyl-carrier-protein] synthase-3